jgi:transposase-like protein
MTEPQRPAIFKWQHFAPEIILCAVRWYLRYSLSYREVEELLKRCRHRPVRYLNNILEQNHRGIKKRIRTKQHFRRFVCARTTIQGYETIHKIRRGQVRPEKRGDIRAQNQFINRVFGIAAKKASRVPPFESVCVPPSIFAIHPTRDRC